ncbi:hypothetical protein A3D78_05090 [Candidatus Gottesmanbacteria bacterium RIFCSPHIGHO2_02_FULL_39_14]|uniref:Uncharacterized protein n=2 Tax=Candidatus Gottesmaniibacteriota TaxID=1752720 RepID=A0A1F5ZYS0_9BACT|nr:MAG: hypothetical protein A2153_02220 [Candidatus Gottesmanbacteria bacterium RBG_16_38_7b]OGG17600.1 MAG: hypothetical protein A3D78_05090 [Candidatus Gottesmanbacteria bacterium RIFCSPHIGHO2_02_FULL_39_14]
MLNFIAIFLTIAVVIVYIFHFFFFWLFPSTDSIFYWQFANFIRNGSYFVPHPYYYTRPSTMEPPLFSLFIYLADSFPKADIMIHFIQLGGIIVSGILIYKILNFYFSKNWALFSFVFFLLTPAHLIYSSNLVAEPLAVFYITIYLYILHKIINLKQVKLLVVLLPYTALITLHRYNLLIFFLTAVFLFLIKRGKDLRAWAGLLAGMTILGGWILINHQLNGSWGLSNAEGKHLYNRILHFDRILPSYSHPVFVKFRKLAGERTDYFKPWWFYEEALIRSTGSETGASLIMREFALAALFSDPLKYFLNTPRFFLFAHDRNTTFDDPLYLFNSNMKKSCQGMGNIRFCRPIINTSNNFGIWDRMVNAVNFFYIWGAKYINYLLLFPALIYSSLQKDSFFRILALLYILSILFFVMVEAPLPRYTYIYTPLGGIITYFALGKCFERVIKKKRE